MLDKQCKVYSVDTGNFYDSKEIYLHLLLHKLKIEKNNLINGRTFKAKNGNKRTTVGLADIEQQIKELSSKNDSESKEKCQLLEKQERIKTIIEHKTKKIKESKEKLLQLLRNKVESNKAANGRHHIRKLNDNQVSQKCIISVFDSFFTRTIGVQYNKLCDDFMVIQAYYFDILQDILLFGYEYNGERYIYFTSSAGQIRTKKCVFIKESIWRKYESTLMCGLTVDKINDLGGINTNKYLAYMALNSSATDEWKEFDIEKTIVVEDFEKNVYGEFDFVDEKDYSITRKKGHIPIPNTDGVGMMLPNAFGVNQVNKMIRCPWIKGLIGVFDFKKFIEVNNCSPVIRDIYGKEHDIIKEDIQLIFTKSQFKLYKFYRSWQDYKNNFKRYGCTVGFTKPEEEDIKNAKINYQMLQSLVEINDEEIENIVSPSIDSLNNLCSSVENIQEIFGAIPENKYKTSFQEAICIYPELINDIFIKNRLREIKNSLVKKYKSGKLRVKGKYTFILPDLYAVCEYLFMGNSEPIGLLQNGEVFCWLFKNEQNDKLDCLRSPHLYCEHAIRRNIANNVYNERQQLLRDWFQTDALYVSCNDLISKILMCDYDGDTSLVVSDKSIISAAERTIQKYNIVPLYYNMRKAKPVILNNQEMYKGLITAFTGGNIGIYSNNISKIWNNDIFLGDKIKEKYSALDCIKRLCCQNNMVIDYAKTLYKTAYPRQIGEEIKQYTSQKLPYFFKYAKDKKESQVTTPNDSLVNKLDSLINNPRIKFKYVNNASQDIIISRKDKPTKLGIPDFRMLLSSKDFCYDDIDIDDAVINRYIDLCHEYTYKANNRIVEQQSPDITSKSSANAVIMYQQIIDDTKQQMSSFKYSDAEIVDMLVKYYYSMFRSKNNKSLMWLVYGDIILNNIKRNMLCIQNNSKFVKCEKCGRLFEVHKCDYVTKKCPKCR